MLENIKNSIYQNLSELFADAALDEMAGDMKNYKERLNQIANIATILGISTEIIQVTLNMKTGGMVFDVDDYDNERNTEISRI